MGSGQSLQCAVATSGSSRTVSAGEVCLRRTGSQWKVADVCKRKQWWQGVSTVVKEAGWVNRGIGLVE